jgi:hypothetical protein
VIFSLVYNNMTKESESFFLPFFTLFHTASSAAPRKNPVCRSMLGLNQELLRL